MKMSGDNKYMSGRPFYKQKFENYALKNNFKIEDNYRYRYDAH